MITPQRVPSCEAHQACERMGMKLAQLRSDNWDRATRSLFKAVGPNQYAWIHSWNEDTYQQAPCVALYTGLTEIGGAVNVPQSCKEPRHALCQRGIRHH